MKLTKIAAALAATLAMATVAVSGASAAQYRSSSASVALFGEGSFHQFIVDNSSVECNTANFEKASQNMPTSEITNLTAGYSGCTAFGFSGATVNMGNCTYKLKQPNTVTAPHKFEANIALVCGGANPMTINSSVFGSECSVSMGGGGNNGNLQDIGLEVETATGHILGDLAVSTMTVTKNKDNGLCPLNGTGTVNNGGYYGFLTFQASGSANLTIS
jgi:hypothetical protein